MDLAVIQIFRCVHPCVRRHLAAGVIPTAVFATNIDVTGHATIWSSSRPTSALKEDGPRRWRLISQRSVDDSYKGLRFG